MEKYFGSNETGLTAHAGRVCFLANFVFRKTAAAPQTLQNGSKTSDESLILPETPASIISVEPNGSATATEPRQGIFETPRTKCSPSADQISGFHSGIRSAIVLEGSKLIRLKGCGNMYEGFKLIPVDGLPNGVQLRGCMFENTCFRELYITDKVKQLLESHSLPWANKPIGWYEYHVECSQPFSNVQRLCALYETRGDLRLAEHLLNGLDSLLSDTFSSAEVENILGSFRKQDRIDSETSTIISTWTAVLSEMNLLSIETVKNQLSPSGSLMVELFYRLGYEVGRFLNLLHRQAQMSWGTYDDQMGFHCNAHPNNLLVLPPEFSSAESLLAPLDFDLAFESDDFTGTPARWEELVAIEVQAMRLALAGLDDLNSGVTAVVEVSRSHQPIQWALRDVIVQGFNDGYSSRPSSVQFDNTQYSRARYLIESAINTTNKSKSNS